MVNTFDQHNTENSHSSAKKAGKALTFTCPNCAGSVTVKAVGHSISAVCNYCSSVIDVTNKNFHILSVAHERTRPTLLTIGSKGVIAGILWEIVGYMEKSDETIIYRWDEYLLYNPYHGFRFLVQSNGHWSLFKVLKKSITQPVGLSGELKFDSTKYQCFQKGVTKVLYVKGEFYWRARKDEESYVTDYIAPPYMLSIAKNHDEINVALGEYIEPKAIEKAFILSSEMPDRTGVGANQPSKYTSKYVAEIWYTFAFAFLLVTIVQFMSSFSANNATLLESSYEIEAANKNQTISSEQFSLLRQTNLEISSYANLNNEWLELDLALVNDKGEDIKETKQALEFYSGSDYDGYYWKEGDQDKDSLFSAVPKGDYRILIDADSGAYYKQQPVKFHIQVKRGVSSWSNYGFTLLLLILYPAFITFRRTSIEASRWSESGISTHNGY